jgi:hypothetical protein
VDERENGKRREERTEPENQAINWKNQPVYHFSFKIWYLNKKSAENHLINQKNRSCFRGFFAKLLKLNFVPKTDRFFWFLIKLVRTGFWRHIDIVIPKGEMVDWMRERTGKRKVAREELERIRASPRHSHKLPLNQINCV